MDTVVNISVIKLLLVLEKISDWSLVQKGVIQHPEDVERSPLRLAVVLHDCNETICDYCNVYLYSHRILSVTPEGFHSEMLLDTTEEQFHLPSLLVQRGYILGLQFKIVCQEGKRSLKFWSIINNPAQADWIFLPCLVSGKAYSLVKENVISSVQQILTIHNLVLKTGFLTDDEVGTNRSDSIKPCQVITAFVKDIEGIRFVRDAVHGVHIMNICLCNMYALGYLRDNIKQRMDLYAALVLAEAGPLIEAQTKVYGCGVKGVELTVKVKLAVYPLALSKIYHVVSEFFEKPVVPMGIGVFQSTSGYNAFAESEMVTLLLMGCNDAGQFPKAVTSGQLSEHHQQELVPARHCLGTLVCIVSLNHLVELFLWQKLHELTEYVFSAVHASLSQLQAEMLRNQFKSFSLVFASNLLYINN